ncbi:MAG: diacylglycerol kinase family protein [Actinomycetota bacterium]|nr:diacylglycerol kinase family protein [Actinomycetota bacterium]
MKTLIILNPSSAKGKSLDLRDIIESEFKKYGMGYFLHISSDSDDIIKTTKANLKKGFSNFIAVGGDGTIHYMANALAGTDKKIGIIPAGSGNDIAACLGISSDIKKCCQIIKRGKTKKIDMGLINDRYYYLCIAGAGFDSQVNYLANNTRLPLKGSARYNYAVYKNLITFKPVKFFISYAGNKREIYGMMIAVSNMSSYGGGMKITPDANPEDGLFDICVIKKMDKIHFIKTFPKVYEGKHTADRHVEIFKTGSIKIDSEYHFSIFADGEYICKLPATFKIIPGNLNFITPG